MNKAIAITITGKVQGVFFRKKIKEDADRLQLTGWVRNNADGTVSIWAEGIEKDLQKLVKKSYNAPNGGKVDSVTKTWQDTISQFSDFSIIR